MANAQIQDEVSWDTLLQRDDDEEDWDTDLEDDSRPTDPIRSSTGHIGASDSSVLFPAYPVQNEPPIHSNEPSPVETDANPSELSQSVKLVLAQIAAVGLTLPKFLLAISWGDPGCTADAHIRGARTSLMNSDDLPVILHNWWKPPRSSASRKSRTRAACNVMEEFAHICLRDVLDRELDDVSALLVTQEDISEEFYTGTKFGDVAQEIENIAPTLWTMLRKSAYTTKQEKKNSRKNPEKIVLVIISMLCYTRSHHANRLQKLFAVYLKFRGLSAKAFDTLHALAFTMSHKWTVNHVAKLSAAAMREVTGLMDIYPWLVSYDNINIPFRVFSQRLDNKDTFSSGVAATVYIKRQAQRLTADMNSTIRERRDTGMQSSITAYDVFLIAQKSYPHVYRQTVHEVLQFLLASPEFDFKTYHGQDSPLLQPPAAVHALPHGSQHVTHQYLLASVNIPEQSYADNERVIDEILRQLGLGGATENECHLATEKIVVWLGDQLTVERLRGLFKYRSQDVNSFDRLDWMVLMFGWLHLQMAFANSLHKQYLGTAAGRGLQHAFTLLGRKGLGSVMTRGPFHHDLEEALYHIAEAHIQVDWMVLSDVKDLSELRTRSPAELLALAERLVKSHASSEALDQLSSLPEDERDEVKYQTTQWNRDILQYIILDKAIKHGDVGLMEALLPTLLYHFMGGGNKKYAIEMLELLQGLHKEWPPMVCDFVRQHCWLVNFEGKRNSFVPVDMAQEHNIKDIKVTYRSEGPNAKWDYFKKLHPALRIIRQLGKHMEREFNTLTRGMKHGVPKKDADVKLLQVAYQEAKLHDYIPGRKGLKAKRDKAPNFISNGAVKLQMTNSLRNWSESRSFRRSHEEDWEDSDVSTSSNGGKE